ncbi:DivIVA domain-containing protein [Mycetocola reblochoni]|uniref:Cell wall synthesis protein Wag31 n=2 Tax=Mycetocola reblochoni TaxID=331618 RepID=A0A1R4J6A7_9MICO|nr:DivIVA domain-containing protein [Mycetocola reblochoni]RLP69618.1 DivIVA domain-containing protein [Mycetocola reblochoni]SJN27671.1 Possibly a cell division protein, antigen 84 in Mycobacteria [Mycetocola reblochoni REB411]
MALTPEDVVNRQFQQTKFREGYDQDEVDDFLDEVVVELRRLNQENQELTERLAQAEQSTGTAETPAPVSAVPATPAPVAAAPVAASSGEDDSESSASLLQLARRLHDEHVREGAEKRDQLVAEGHATAARVIAEAEATQREQMAKLNEQRGVLEKKIDQLRQFEREYRQKLRSYIESQLSELDEDKQSPSAFAGSDSASA